MELIVGGYKADEPSSLNSEVKGNYIADALANSKRQGYLTKFLSIVLSRKYPPFATTPPQ